MMMNCFCGMIDRRKSFSLISSRDHFQRSSPSRISDTSRARFEPAQNQSSGFVEWICAVVITATPQQSRVDVVEYIAEYIVVHIVEFHHLIKGSIKCLYQFVCICMIAITDLTINSRKKSESWTTFFTIPSLFSM